MSQLRVAGADVTFMRMGYPFRCVVRGAKSHPRSALVLQPGFMVLRLPAPVATASALLMASAPDGPVQDGGWSGWAVPDQAPEQASHLGHGHWQQFGGEIAPVLSPRWRPYAAQRGRRAPA